MAKIESKVRQLRLSYGASLGRAVPVQEVADAIGVDRKRLTQIELGKMKEIDTETLLKLCEFYKVGVGAILEYNPDGIRTPGHAAPSLVTA
jgi:DNA-binding Xre family transcriptional regulator